MSLHNSRSPQRFFLGNLNMQSTTAFVPDYDRYLRIAEWARARYTTNGVLELSKGGVPSRFKRIENAAWKRYMRSGPIVLDFSRM